jgi:hypothetical protein
MRRENVGPTYAHPCPKVRWHPSPEAIHAAFVASLEEATGESLEGATWGGEDADGKHVEFTPEQMIDGYRAQGMWGFCDGERIHLWAESYTSDGELAWLAGHELAHLWGADRPAIRDDGEAYAELVGEIAYHAHLIATNRTLSSTDPFSCSRN